MGTWLKVGERFPFFSKNIHNLQNQDGSIFEALDEDAGYLLSIFLNKPNQNEMDMFHEKTTQIRLYERDEFVLPLIRFGSSDFIFEMSFDPTLYSDGRAFQFKGTNNTLFISLIDSSNDFKVLGLRAGNLPLKMIQKCSKHWAKACLEVDYANRYRQWYKDTQDNLWIKQVWDRAVYVGKLGETYDLNEIFYEQ